MQDIQLKTNLVKQNVEFLLVTGLKITVYVKLHSENHYCGNWPTENEKVQPDIFIPWHAVAMARIIP